MASFARRENRQRLLFLLLRERPPRTAMAYSRRGCASLATTAAANCVVLCSPKPGSRPSAVMLWQFYKLERRLDPEEFAMGAEVGTRVPVDSVRL
eukprot:1125787-Pyramimonas_sp.AAC.1